MKLNENIEFYGERFCPIVDIVYLLSVAVMLAFLMCMTF